MNAPAADCAPPEPARLLRFFLPLAAQAASQALCYPLVAMVASRSPGGPLNLAGLAQSNTIMFFLGIFAISMVTTGMVFAGTREGYRQFCRLTLTIGGAVAALQAVLSLPAASHWLFGRLIGLPPSIEAPAQVSLLASVPLQFLFFSRIPYFVAMYVGKASGMASLATFGRVAFTALLSPLFCMWGWVGPVWAVVALTVPVGFEALVSRALARPLLKALPPTTGKPPALREIFWFNLPLSVGGLFLSLSTLVLAGFIARAADPERVLPVYYLALGLASPAAYAATRIQTVVLVFPPPSPSSSRRTLSFAIATGAVLGVLPLLFVLPGLDRLYYVTLQNLDPADLTLVRSTAAALVLFPLSVGIRAHSEGLAAWLRKPITVLAGHGVFLTAILAAGSAALALGVPGQFIGAAGLTTGSLVSAATIGFLLKRRAAWGNEEKPR
jgi:hypothetical protein